MNYELLIRKASAINRQESICYSLMIIIYLFNHTCLSHCMQYMCVCIQILIQFASTSSIRIYAGMPALHLCLEYTLT